MSLNILLGVGGTGAKVVESALVSAFAGLGPASLTVGFVDQDESNGNVARSRELLETLGRFQTLWGAQGGQDTLFWGRPEENGATLGRVRVRAFNPLLWCPHPEQGKTLGGLFGAAAFQDGDAALNGLLEILYAPDASELEMDLGVGYRGRPHVGAAAMLARLCEAENPFARTLGQALKDARGGREVRIFLIGSVFGGTGAAGFPNLARALRALGRGDDADAPSGLRIGGALMLPYFGFEPPPGAMDNVARSEDLLRNSQAALKYYHQLFQQEAVFDAFYLTGWDPCFQLGYHSPGSASQANPPLPPELYGALAAMRFFDEGAVAGPGRNPVYISSRAQPDQLCWEDLPAVSADGPTAYQAIGALLRFCVAWRYSYRPVLNEKYGLLRPAKWQWWRNYRLKDVRLDQPDTARALGALDELVDLTLHWAAAMQAYATTDRFGAPALARFELWDLHRVALFDPTAPKAPIKLQPPGTAAAADAYDGLIRPRAASATPSGQAVLNAELNERPPEPLRHTGAGALVAAVHRGARLGGDQVQEHASA